MDKEKLRARILAEPNVDCEAGGGMLADRLLDCAAEHGAVGDPRTAALLREAERELRAYAKDAEALREALELAKQPCECYTVHGRNSDGSEQDADVQCDRCFAIDAALSRKT